MSISFHKITFCLFVLFAMCNSVLYGQTEMTTDELYTKARNTAFEEDDYVWTYNK